MYYIFTFESLNNFDLAILRMWKNCFVNTSPPGMRETEDSVGATWGKTFASFKCCMLEMGNEMLALI